MPETLNDDHETQGREAKFKDRLGSSAKYLADLIKHAGIIVTLVFTTVSLLAWATWELQLRLHAEGFIHKTISGNPKQTRQWVLDALLDIDPTVVKKRINEIAQIAPDKAALFENNNNLAGLPSRLAGKFNDIDGKISDFHVALSEHQKTFSNTIDSWQSFEFYRYYPSKIDDQNNWQADRSLPAFIKEYHDIIAYPNDNLLLYFYSHNLDAGGYQRDISRTPIIGLKIEGEKLKFPHPRINGNNISLYCYTTRKHNVDMRFDPTEPKQIRLEVILEKGNEDTEFTYKVYVVSTKLKPSQEECPEI